jgi:hypothetical protein
LKFTPRSFGENCEREGEMGAVLVDCFLIPYPKDKKKKRKKKDKKRTLWSAG